MEAKVPTVFISYAWTSEEHIDWVVALATRLVESGIDVKFDKWDLKEGYDVYAFMESMVASDDIDKVLIICDRGYKDKADNRSGGVGTETQIITPEVYSDAKQQKFIPIVAERGNDGESFVPVYISSRLYIDLSTDEIFEEGFEQLLRCIFDKPVLKKPELGKPPAYLFNENVTSFKTTNILKQLNDSITRNPKRIKSLSVSFIESLLESLEQFKIQEVKDKDNLDDIIVDFIEKMLPLRNDYVQFIEILCDHDELSIVDAVTELFEKLYSFTYFSGDGSYYEIQFDQFKFFIQELFIYTCMIIIEKKQFVILAELLNTEFYIENKYQEERRIKYTGFRFYISSLDAIRNSKLRLNKISVTAHMLVERSNLKRYPQDKLISTDMMLYYLSAILFKDGAKWFPCTYVYAEYKTIKFLSKLRSRKYFEKVKSLFGVSTSDELKARIIGFNNEYSNGYQNGRLIPTIAAHIKPEDICTIP